jgi:acetolactate synthase regulatory subunit
LPSSATAISVIQVQYPDGRGILRQLLQIITERGFSVDQMSTEAAGSRADQTDPETADGARLVEVALHVYGNGSVNDLATRLHEISGVRKVTANDINSAADVT